MASDGAGSFSRRAASTAAASAVVAEVGSGSCATAVATLAERSSAGAAVIATLTRCPANVERQLESIRLVNAQI